MEQNTGFKQVVELIRTLERQLVLCAEADDLLLLHAKGAEELIEVHFEKCFTALAARKATLLSAFVSAVSVRKKSIEDAHKKVKDSIEGCKRILEAGTFLYASSITTAESVWMGVKKNLLVPTIVKATITPSLDAKFITDIQEHGSISLEEQFSRADRVTTLVGSCGGFVDGNALNAKLDSPNGLCLDPKENCLYVCDAGNHAIRKVTLQGVVSTVVSAKGLSYPFGIVLNFGTKDLFITDSDSHTVKKITPSGDVSVFAGDGEAGYRDGHSAMFFHPYGIAINQATGDLFVSDDNHAIRSISPNGYVSTLAGSGVQGYADGQGKDASFAFPCGLTFNEANQSILVCDLYNHKLRAVSLAGEVTTVCDIQRPTCVEITSNNIILVSSYGENRLFKVTNQGPGKVEVEVLAGSGMAERKDGKAKDCGFFNPYGLAVHERSLTCFVAEDGSNSIRRVSFSN